MPFGHGAGSPFGHGAGSPFRHGAGFGDDLVALLAGADVLITDNDNVSGDPTALHERFPQLVVVAITPYGLHGPYADRPATEITIQAESGALAVRGHPSREPVQAGGRTMEWVSAFDLVALARLLRGRAAATSNPYRRIRSMPWRVKTPTCCATSCGVPR